MASGFREWRPGILSSVRERTLCVFVFQVLCLLGALSASVSVVKQFTKFKFILEPIDTIGYKGEPALLDCLAEYNESSQSVEIAWRKDDQIIDFTTDTRRIRLSNGSLYISKTSPMDVGAYECEATATAADGSQHTILTGKANMEVAYISRNFKTNPASLSVYLLDDAMFECQIDGVPKPNITWYKDNSPIIDRTTKYRSYPDGVLRINDVAFSDLGNYYCVAEVAAKSRRSATAKLEQNADIVNFQDGIAPTFVLRPRNTKALVKSKVVLFCGANGRDAEQNEPTITWLKNGVTIDFSQTTGRIALIDGGNLQILNLNESDDGTYTCRAENSLDSVDTDVKLTVLVPPVIKNPPLNVYKHANTEVVLPCEITGQPKPSVWWTRNGDHLEESDYIDVNDAKSLTIMGLMKSDSGYYQCFGSNEAGNVQAGAQLVVLDKDIPLPITNPSTPSIYYHVHRSGASYLSNRNELPSEPTELKAAIVSTRFVTLSWNVPNRTGPSEIIAYSIHWQEIGSERERVMNTTTPEANIQRLKPNTEYEFRIKAYNRYGPSPNFASLRVTTDREVDVPSEVQNLRAMARSPISIEVKWDPPAHAKGTVMKYFMIYYAVGDAKEHQVTISGSSTSHILMSLQKFTEYSFRLVASNENGPGMSSEEVVARTYSDIPSNTPQNFTLETASSTSIVVRWAPPPVGDRNGIITGYKIRYKKRGARRGETVTTDGNRELYALTDLKKNNEYSVRISAQTVNGSGPVTDWHKATTFEDDLDESQVPDIPDRLVVKASTNSLLVQWVPNRKSNVLVRGYVLGYGKGIPDVYRQVLDADTFFHNIENLQPASEYVVSIRAYNDKGEGQPRYETIFTREITEEESVTPMLPPIGLKAIVLSAHTIVVTWTDDSLGRSQEINDQRYYTVRYVTAPANRGRNKFINATDLNCHIDELKPNTKYEFSVKVIKGRRQSTWSMAVVNTTQEAAPGSMPRDLTAVRLENDPLAVTLNWQPPQKPNGQITGYLVFYTTDPSQNDRDWVVEGVLGDKLSTTITDLTRDTTYYFKVQARNRKGYGPMSQTLIHKTPKDFYGRGKNIYDRWPSEDISGTISGNVPPTEPGNGKSKGDQESGPLTQNVMIIIIACVVGVTFCIVVAVVTVVLCRKRDNAERNKRQANLYDKSPVKGKGPKPGLPGDTRKPPDLWIDHDPVELKNMSRIEHGGSTISVASTRRNSQDTKSIDTQGMDMESQRESLIAELHSGSDREDRGLPPPNYNQLQQIPSQQRNIIRPTKPIMISVDTQGPPRELATVTAYPNGHLMQRFNPGSLPSPVEDSGVPPMRPVFPRTQYPMQYAAQGPPRVNAGDVTQPSSMHGFSLSDLNCRLPILEEDTTSLCDPLMEESFTGRVGYGSIPRDDKVSFKKKDKAPITGIASPVVSSDGSRSLPRGTHPLKTFSVPDPPLAKKPPGTPTTPKHIVKPQQTSSPYKKPTPPISSGPIKPRAPVPVVSPKAPDLLKTGQEDHDIVVQKSVSTEELTAEMANLEGLMKDLNAITQQDFEC